VRQTLGLRWALRPVSLVYRLTGPSVSSRKPLMIGIATQLKEYAPALESQPFLGRPRFSVILEALGRRLIDIEEYLHLQDDIHNPIVGQSKGGQMSPQTLFQIQLVLGYIAWLLCFGVYVLPRLKSMERFEAQRLIATLHSFRFFGLVFILPGMVDPHLPTRFAVFAAHWDLATAVLAMLALLTTRIRPLFWFFIVAFNVVGTIDLMFDYYHAVQVGLPALAGQLGAAYAIPVLYVPLLMISHFAAFYLLMRPQPKAARVLTRAVVAS